MIVIYEQNYDLVDIIDVIEDDKFDEYLESYRTKILSEERYSEILEEKEQNGSYDFKIVYTYPNSPVDWIGFNYVKFDKINNYKDE